MVQKLRYVDGNLFADPSGEFVFYKLFSWVSELIPGQFYYCNITNGRIDEMVPVSSCSD